MVVAAAAGWYCQWEGGYFTEGEKGGGSIVGIPDGIYFEMLLNILTLKRLHGYFFVSFAILPCVFVISIVTFLKNIGSYNLLI